MKEYKDRPAPASWEPPADELIVGLPWVGVFPTVGGHE